MQMHRRSSILALAGCLAVALPSTASAQGGSSTPAIAAPTKPLIYDVITIKPNKSGSGSVNINSRGDSFSASNVSLKNLLQDVYDIKEDQISGIPAALDSARFDIEAKVVEFDPDVKKAMTDEQQRQMLLPELIERFQLKTHTEIKTLPVFELTVTKAGLGLTQSEDQTKNGGGSTRVSGRNSLYKLTARHVPMPSLAKTLSGQVHRPIIDKTGLTRNFDFELNWSSEDSPPAQADAAPDIFTALQEQLGLKLQPAKGPVETLVVQHAEMPSEN